MSFCHIIVGATNTGKSHFVKNLLRKAKSKTAYFIYDVNNEYKEFFPYPFIGFTEFIKKATRIERSIMVFEEATIFFNNRSTNEYLYEILVRKKHTGNCVFLLFHSMRSVPRYIYETSNYITIFKTNDSPDMSARELKDERLKDIMLKVRNNTDPKFNHINKDGTLGSHFCETLKIY